MSHKWRFDVKKELSIKKLDTLAGKDYKQYKIMIFLT